MTIAISGHGTLLARATAALPTTFVDIAEVGDIKSMALTRNEFDATTQNRNIDAFVVGVPRRGAFSTTLHFLPTHASHDHVTGLQKAFWDGTLDGYRLTFPSSLVWIASGYVTAFDVTAPVDGKLTADLTVRMTDVMSINGVAFGL